MDRFLFDRNARPMGGRADGLTHALDGKCKQRLWGLILVAAGLYQWTPLKDVCLRQCQFPLQFIQRHGGFRADAIGSLTLGARHGVYCVGCCWVLMALLFVGGVMNVFWIALISIFVLAEKVVPVRRLISRFTGTLLLAVGVWLIASSLR
jgi:predicted metal-binding membrane protein